MIEACKKNIKDKKTTIIGIILVVSSIVYAFLTSFNNYEFNSIVFTSFLLIGIGLILSPDKLINKLTK